ncbi:sugar phosphate isomerase/epimerase [Alphaproteobacteria bacterium KMM 3653]|uniref:Sugar phosphate isomerase/epimerase n=1 Tax=Harenicola maris TaxID=2841044 RepID=A0AAP2G5K1_9RHOB|nr:sugar phosphate isomerase/epimerase [Harenicola maris]
MQFCLCNEVLRDLPFEQQCRMAAQLGYSGIELAPFTLGDAPHLMPAARRREVRAMAEDAGVPIIGLHWLLVAPEGLSITSSDPDRAGKTRDVMLRLVELCADLGGRVLVHGSPGQRDPAHAPSPAAARSIALDHFAAAGRAAAQAGLTYCIEPLAPRETPFINTVAEAISMVEEADTPGLKTMIDTSAASLSESLPVAQVIRDFWPGGQLAHIQVNDRNRRAPGQGGDSFGPVLQALRDVGYGGPISVEPFIYEPDGPTTAAVAIGYLKALCEGDPHG